MRILSLVQFIVNFIKIINKFYKALQIAFEDFDKKVIIYRFIQKLRQANRLFHQYLANFESRIYENDINERNQRYHFLNNLNNELRFVIIIYRVNKINFVELKKLLQYINNN